MGAVNGNGEGRPITRREVSLAVALVTATALYISGLSDMREEMRIKDATAANSIEALQRVVGDQEARIRALEKSK